ncbi:DUF4955 domain-containing protein [Maribacter sp. 2308TA10-17]|uniref:DUF4955 domain-containing protein n=1 Tax=Maribacter sp. 2308TA10-17 TaxID=3386276 RepID=UPI0039BCA634
MRFKLAYSSALSLCLLCIACKAQESKVWQDFKTAKEKGREPLLPDFSFAGYKYSEVAIPKAAFKKFNVVDYGAVPDDSRSDKRAIQDAINAATKYGEGIIFFPRGRYLINTADDELDIIHITSSKIVFQGENRDYTVLFFEKDLPAIDPLKMWTCPYAITTKVKLKSTLITKIIEDARRESNTVTVKNINGIKKGDWLILQVQNNAKELIDYDLNGLKIEPKWTSLIRDGVEVNERHKVKSIDENRITFETPIHYDVKAKYNWQLLSFPNLHHIGFENLTFEGNWKKKFVHHRSAQHDGGWSILGLSKIVDSWIRDCTFKNVNRPVSISASAATTALNIDIEGAIGHNSLSAGGGSTGILFANINDKAGMHHTTGVSGGSTTGTVIWRSKHPSNSSFESHASQPRCTLFDNVEGGFFAGRAGGAIKNLPNHGRNLVLWNYKETDSAETNFNFVAKDSDYWRIVPPIIVGFHGSGTTFNQNEVQIAESISKPVKPESLFEEQLKLRLGRLPQWIIERKKNIDKAN